MDQVERQKRIVEYLRIKPISHGQVYTFQVAVPKSQMIELTSQRREDLSRSLTEQGSNLIPLIVRRTEAYSEEEEYEVVYGADWCIVAKEIGIEKLWVWVFNMTDEQATVARTEMEQLVGSIGVVSSPIEEINQIRSLVQTLEEALATKIEVIQSEIQKLGLKIDLILKKIEPKVEEKLNLLLANLEEIEEALEKNGIKSKQKEAILNAIKYWKGQGRDLTWTNLKKSTKSGKDKIKDFANTSYENLRKIGDLPN